VSRAQEGGRAGLVAELERLRGMIDAVDSEIIRLLGERLRICREIGAVKKAMGAGVLDEAREEAVLRRAGVFQAVFQVVVELCKSVQEG
jgi:chorismate mutase